MIRVDSAREYPLDMAADSTGDTEGSTPSTAAQEYTDRLVSHSGARWKSVLNVQAPYKWNIQRICRGRTLDVGCGIGRHLEYLDRGSVGVDHNSSSIAIARAKGLESYVTDEFLAKFAEGSECFDTILIAHVLEHLGPNEARELLRTYLPFLKLHGRLVVICPQERGFASDPTHVTWIDMPHLRKLVADSGFRTTTSMSFPFPRIAGRYFTHNESIVVGDRRISASS